MASAIHHIVDKAKAGVSKDRGDLPNRSQDQSQGRPQSSPGTSANNNLHTTTSNDTSNAGTSPRKSRAADFFRVKTKESQADIAQREEEKEFISAFEEDDTIVSPDKLASDPRVQKLGGSSQKLRIEDFQLVKTLGTGMSMDLKAVLDRISTLVEMGKLAQMLTKCAIRNLRSSLACQICQSNSAG